MKYRKFGATGLTVSEIGFGSNTISGAGTYGVNDEEQGRAAVKRAYELGVTFYDTAEGYSEGRSETVLGEILGNKQDVVICSKVGGRARKLSPEVLREACVASLQRLQRDAIDVYLLHNPTDDVVADPAYVQALEALKSEGLIKSYGVSLLLESQIEQGLIGIERGYSSFEVEFNLVIQEPAEKLLPESLANGVGLIVRVPLASGLLSGKYTADSVFAQGDRRAGAMPADQMRRAYEIVSKLGPLAQQENVPMAGAAIAWILQHPEISTVIPGCKNVEQVEQNVAASDISLSPAWQREIAAIG